MTPRAKRLLVLLSLLLAFVGCMRWRARWHPDFTVETAHFFIDSSATLEQTEEIGRVAEAVYNTYTNFFAGHFAASVPYHKMKMKLYKNRREFRGCG